MKLFTSTCDDIYHNVFYPMHYFNWVDMVIHKNYAMFCTLYTCITTEIYFLFLIILITECPPAMDGMERFACPSPDRQGRYRCIDDHVLCDGFIDCPGREDEDRQACMFYKTVSIFFLYFLLYIN